MVINKPSGMVTPPEAAHRLDKDTTGVLVISKTDEVRNFLQQQFKNRQVKKEYQALVYGAPKEESGIIEQPLKRSSRFPMRRTIHKDGKQAVTEWEIEKKFGDDFALLRLKPKTGRTHQLRAHLHWLGHPIVGDKLYFFKKQSKLEAAARQMLHASKLSITLPNGEQKSFSSPLPEDFHEVFRTIS